MKTLLVVFGGTLMLGCSGERTRSLDPVPRGRAAALETTDDGKQVLQVEDGRLVGLEGRRLELTPGSTTFLVYFNPENAPEPEGEDPLGISVWIRGQGDRRHTLPSFVSPFVTPGNSDDWTLGLKAGTYDLSLQRVGFEGESSEAILLVR